MMEDENEIMTPATVEPGPGVNEPAGKKNQSRNAWFNWLLLLSVIALYALFIFFVWLKKERPVIPEAALYRPEGGMKIAFINSDSLRTHYLLVTDLQKELEEKFSKLNNDITNRQTTLESKAAELQRKFDERLINMEEAQQQDERLKEESRKLYDLNQQYSERMAGEEDKLNSVYIDSINHFLERFNQQYRFDYILGYSRGGGILYARDTLDITTFVLEGLNAEYREKYPESKKK